MSSILEEFDADRYEEDLKQIYREEGIEIGIEKGKEEGIKIGIEKGEELGKQEIKRTINSVFQQFNQGKSDEEIFRSGISSSMEEIMEYRAIWKIAKEPGK